MQQPGQTHIQLDDLLRTQSQLLAAYQPGRKADSHSMLAGLQHISQRGRSMEFDHSRIYQQGDDVRNIDWRVSARTGKLHSKVFQQERERPVLLLIEQSPALCFASRGNFMSVQAAYLASYFAWLAYNNHDRISGLIFAEQPLCQIKSRRSQQAVLRLLYELSLANQKLREPASCRQNPLSTALSHGARLLRPSSLIILICAQQHLQQQHIEPIRALGKKHDLILAPISDPMQHSLPTSKQLIFYQRRQYLSLNSKTAAAQHWQQQFDQRQQLWQQLARQSRAAFLPISTASSISTQLAALARNRFAP